MKKITLFMITLAILGWSNGVNAQNKTNSSKYLMIAEVNFYWQSQNANWAIVDTTIYTYDANNNKTSGLRQVWNTSSNVWVNSLKNTYTYDANNNKTTWLEQYWSTSSNAWVYSPKYTYTYDANNNKTSALEQKWNTSSNAWVNSYLMKYYYKIIIITGIEARVVANELLAVYPNPSNGKFTVTMEDVRMTDVKLAVYNVLGERVYSATHLQITKLSNYQIDLSALPAGIYFLQVNTGDEIVNRKLVLEK